MNRKLIIGLGLIGGLIIILSVLIITQSYPVAFVNWQPIIFKSFEKEVFSALYYYQKALETYDSNQVSIIESKEINQEVKRAVLERLIEDALIGQELRKRINNNELEKMVERRINEVIKNESELQKQAKIIYNLSLEEFKKMVLKPQTEQEILASRLLLENVDFDNWQKEIRQQAKVLIFLPGFEWKDGEVIIKEN